MSEIALYYPYVHPRDESWVKQALLYWPKIQRIVPDNYPVTDSPMLRLLVEREILVKRKPDTGAADIAGAFVKYIMRRRDSLRESYGLQRAYALPPQEGWNDGQLDPRLGWIHQDKLDPEVSEALFGSELATRHSDSEWLGVHPALFNVYMCSLAGGLVRRTPDLTFPVTDGPLHYVGAFGWSVDSIGDALLTDIPRPTEDRRQFNEESPASTLIAVALRSLAPAGLGNIPVERILELREKHASEFSRYRSSLGDLASKVADLEGVRDADTMAQHIQVLYDQSIGSDLDDLRKVLQASRIKTMFTALSFQVAAPSTVVGGGLGTVTSPEVAAGAATAIAVAKVAYDLAGQRTEARKASSAAWLVRVEELVPQTLRGRIGASLRRFTG